MRKICIKCGRTRSVAYMQEAVFKEHTGEEEGVDIWRCKSPNSCRAARKKCPRCGHMAWKHGTALPWVDGTIYVCDERFGMGDFCGCKEKM